MSKNLEPLIKSLIATGNSLITVANELKEELAKEPEIKEAPALATPAVEPEAPSREITFEEIRNRIIEKTKHGSSKEEMQALVKKYSSSGKLSDIPPEKYTDVIAELEASENG